VLGLIPMLTQNRMRSADVVAHGYAASAALD
jgi:hypothetical protein